MPQLVVQGRLERRDGGSPCFVRVPASLLAGWRLAGAVEIQASLGGHELGRRTLKRYDSGTWMVELANIHLRWAGLSAGDSATLTIRSVDAEPEPEPEAEPEPPPPAPKPAPKPKAAAKAAPAKAAPAKAAKAAPAKKAAAEAAPKAPTGKKRVS